MCKRIKTNAELYVPPCSSCHSWYLCSNAFDAGFVCMTARRNSSDVIGRNIADGLPSLSSAICN